MEGAEEATIDIDILPFPSISRAGNTSLSKVSRGSTNNLDTDLNKKNNFLPANKSFHLLLEQNKIIQTV